MKASSERKNLIEEVLTKSNNQWVRPVFEYEKSTVGHKPIWGFHFFQTIIIMVYYSSLFICHYKDVAMG